MGPSNCLLPTLLQARGGAEEFRVGASHWVERRAYGQSAEVPVHWPCGERDWSVCVGVEPGRHAELFIRNEFSSLTTQVIALRLRRTPRCMLDEGIMYLTTTHLLSIDYYYSILYRPRSRFLPFSANCVVGAVESGHCYSHPLLILAQ